MNLTNNKIQLNKIKHGGLIIKYFFDKLMNIIELENCKKGFILKGFLNHYNYGHLIIFLELIDHGNFIGAMISTKNRNDLNLLMSDNHFLNEFENGTKCLLSYNDSHLVIAKLNKFFMMGPFQLYDQLSTDGINFVEENINHLILENWEEYLIRTE